MNTTSTTLPKPTHTNGTPAGLQPCAMAAPDKFETDRDWIDMAAVEGQEQLWLEAIAEMRRVVPAWRIEAKEREVLEDFSANLAFMASLRDAEVARGDVDRAELIMRLMEDFFQTNMLAQHGCVLI